MKIAFDFDDVLVDFVGCYLDALETETGRHYDRKDISLDGWDMSTWANGVLGLGQENPMAWLEWMRPCVGLWETAKTTPGALPALWALERAGHELEIVTNKPRWAYSVVWSWLNRTDAPFSTVRILNGFSKEEASDADVLVDDRPSTVRAWNASRPGRIGILYARRQNEQDRKGLYVAQDMQDVVHAIEREREALLRGK